VEQRTSVGNTVEEIRQDNLPNKNPKEKPPVVVSRDMEQRTPVGSTVDEVRQDAVSKQTAFRDTMQRKMRLDRSAMSVTASTWQWTNETFHMLQDCLESFST
jgi:hypothetical protein